MQTNKKSSCTQERFWKLMKFILYMWMKKGIVEITCSILVRSSPLWPLNVAALEASLVHCQSVSLWHVCLHWSTAQGKEMKRSSKRELGIDAGCCIILIHFVYLIGFCNILRTQVFEDNWAKLVFADALNICESSTVRQAVSLLCLFKIFNFFHKNHAIWTWMD